MKLMISGVIFSAATVRSPSFSRSSSSTMIRMRPARSSSIASGTETKGMIHCIEHHHRPSRMFRLGVPPSFRAPGAQQFRAYGQCGVYIFRQNGLVGMMTDAAGTPEKEHGCRHLLRQDLGVMPGAADHSMHRKAGRFHGLLQHFEMQGSGGLLQQGFAVPRQTPPLGGSVR